MAVSILLHAGFGRNDRREDIPHFILVNSIRWQRVWYQILPIEAIRQNSCENMLFGSFLNRTL